jgi:beta-glucosidase/6-phospho-beta-glucosidase/beta-galactosidase
LLTKLRKPKRWDDNPFHGLEVFEFEHAPVFHGPADIAATRRLDGMENRLFLDPLLQAEYPKDIIDYYQSITDFAFIKDERFESDFR